MGAAAAEGQIGQRQCRIPSALTLFQGYQAFFRNTHAHGVTETDRDLALQALMLFSLLTNILASATKIEVTEGSPSR